MFMVAAFRPPKFNPLAIIWSARLRALQSLLHRFPADPNAWRWQIGHRILSYLLTRYPEGPGRPATAPQSAGKIRNPQSTIRNESAVLNPQSAIIHTPPRSRASIAVILTRIAAANADR